MWGLFEFALRYELKARFRIFSFLRFIESYPLTRLFEDRALTSTKTRISPSFKIKSISRRRFFLQRQFFSNKEYPFLLKKFLARFSPNFPFRSVVLKSFLKNISAKTARQCFRKDKRNLPPFMLWVSTCQFSFNCLIRSSPKSR